MKQMVKLGWRNVIAICAVLACDGSWAAGQVRSVRDRAEVTNMMDRKKTLCVGRFLVDVPEQAETSLSGEWIQGFDIHTVEESDPLRPFLTLNMETGTNPRPGGKPVDSSLHENAVVALWDSISSSIRLRRVSARSCASDSSPFADFSQACLQSDNTACMADEVMFDIPRLDYRTVLNRQSILSSDLDSIAKLASTLP